MRVRTDRPSNVVLLSELARLEVESRKHAARVIDFDCIHMRQDCKQILLLPATRTPPVKWMRHTNERALVLEPLNGFSRRKPSWNLFPYERSKDLPPRGRDFLPYNDQFRVKCMSRPRARNRIVIGDNNPVDPFTAAYIYQITWASEAVT